MIYNTKLDVEQHRALELMLSGANSLITGPGGTGKTHILEIFKLNSSNRNIVYLAPTGIAAQNINIKGMTIHRFFEFNNGIPDLLEAKTYSASKLEIFRCLDCIVIDEISMVSALLLDTIDKVLRLARNSNKPFAGVQIVVVGDFHQLSPIITDELKINLNRTYPGYYAFCAQSWKAAQFQTVELTGNYRQCTDKLYSSILRHIRDFTLGVGKAIEYLNKHEAKCRAENKQPNPLAVNLCARNKDATEINNQYLAALPGKTYEYPARIEGLYYNGTYPGEHMLKLKLGAKVIFLTNKPPFYANGTVGHIFELAANEIQVQLENGNIVSAEQHIWEDTEYDCCEAVGEMRVNSKVIGSMTQYPLKLAHAVSIHKSQGMSLNAANIFLGDGAFSEGQIFVALSRIRSLDGLRLDKPINVYEASPNPMVKAFYEGMLIL